MLLDYVLIVFNVYGGWEGIDQGLIIVLGVGERLKLCERLLVVDDDLSFWFCGLIRAWGREEG